MSRTTLLVIGIVLILLGLAGMAVILVYTQSSSSCPGCSQAPLGGSPTNPVARDVDAMFIQEMIPHHEDAIAMAELAESRAEHPELKQLAEDIVRTQSAENESMRGWYRDWFGSSVPSGGGMMGGQRRGGMMGGDVSIDELETAEPFDKAFIEQMIPHHQMGIMMSQMAGGAASTPEIRELAESIIDSQSAEIEQMQEWYQEWYGR